MIGAFAICGQLGHNDDGTVGEPASSERATARRGHQGVPPAASSRVAGSLATLEAVSPSIRVSSTRVVPINSEVGTG